MRDDTSEEELREIIAKLTRNAGMNNQKNGNSLFKLGKGVLTDEKLRDDAYAEIMQFIKAYGLQCKIDEVAKMPISSSMGVIYRYKRDRRATLTALKKATATSNGVKGDES